MKYDRKVYYRYEDLSFSINNQPINASEAEQIKSESNLKYKASSIDWNDYFYESIGVTRPDGIQVHEIVLKFSPDVAPYVITKPLHPSQKHKKRLFRP